MRNRRDDMAFEAMRLWQQAAQAWWGMMTPWMSGMDWRPDRDDGCFDEYEPEPEWQPLGIQIGVHAKRQVEVEAHLDPVYRDSRLWVEPLAPRDGNAEPIKTVHLDRRGDHLQISVRVPDGQVYGTYRGSIYAEHHAHRHHPRHHHHEHDHPGHRVGEMQLVLFKE